MRSEEFEQPSLLLSPLFLNGTSLFEVYANYEVLRRHIIILFFGTFNFPVLFFVLFFPSSNYDHYSIIKIVPHLKFQ